VSDGTRLLLMALPFLALVVAFFYVPLFGWIYAFFDYHPGIPLIHTKFIGLGSFVKIAAFPSEIIRVMRNTMVMSLLAVVSAPLPMILAILLNEVRIRWFKKTVQTTTTVPNFISWVVVYSLCFSIFSDGGLWNSLLSSIGLPLPKMNVLGNNKAVWGFQWAIGTWKVLGWGSIIYLATISGIDPELYDAARVDGANRFQTILHVTVPGLYSTFLVLLLLTISNLLNTGQGGNAGFEQYFVFFNPLVANRIEVLDYYVYKVGFLTDDYPRSVALGMAKTIISVCLLFSANIMSKRLRGHSIV
jgi:putative aldouronate transport system permease protein